MSVKALLSPIIAYWRTAVIAHGRGVYMNVVRIEFGCWGVSREDNVSMYLAIIHHSSCTRG
jgi:hypothetical protein